MCVCGWIKKLLFTHSQGLPGLNGTDGDPVSD